MPFRFSSPSPRVCCRCAPRGPCWPAAKTAGAGAGISRRSSRRPRRQPRCCGDAERACCRRACAATLPARRFAARFPDPAVNYRTPAFDNGRTAFTSMPSLQFLLRGLARPAGPDGTWVTVMPPRLFAERRALERWCSRAAPIRRHRRCCKAAALTRVVDRAATWRRTGWQRSALGAWRRSWPAQAAKPARTHQCGDLAACQPGWRAGCPAQPPAAAWMPTAIPAAEDPDAQARRGCCARVSARAGDPSDTHGVTGGRPYLEKFGAIHGMTRCLPVTRLTANLPPFITKASEEWFREPIADSLAQQG